jgi:NADPH-dependent F420 reductase
MSEDTSLIITLAVIGGTGKEGSGLALRWALNGYRVIIGSRSAERAQEHAQQLNDQINNNIILGMSNEEATQQAEIVVLSVPYSAHQSTLETIKPYLTGKILVDVTVPLQPPAVRTVHLPEGKSASLEAQALLGDDVYVVSAFQNVSAEKLKDPHADVACDVLVCSDHADAKKQAIQLVEGAGMRGFDAGPLANSVATESLTPVLLYLNKTYKAKGAGIRITNID